jgi:glucosyl-3-phosphoglycerate synthase
VLGAVLDGGLDVAVGRFPALGGGGFGLVRRLAGRLVERLGGVRLASPLSGQRALTREALWACRPLAGGFGMETAMSIDAGRLGLRVGEVPVDMRHRPTGRGPAGFAHRARQGLDVLAAAAPRALGLR